MPRRSMTSPPEKPLITFEGSGVPSNCSVVPVPAMTIGAGPRMPPLWTSSLPLDKVTALPVPPDSTCS